jgi:hypothetical protein
MMTGQTKHFIEVTDIIALRLLCKECHAELSVPIDKNIRVKSLRACPNCNAPWTWREESSIEPIVQKVVDAINGLGAAIGPDRFPLGCLLRLEIRVDNEKGL